jgi:hypothetical protein
MYLEPEVERRRTVVHTPEERRETVTETQKESGISGGLIALIAVFALLAIGLTYYIVSNKNANEEANRQAVLDASRNQQPVTVQQPAPQQPVIIQQPAPAQQAPVIIQQPPQSSAQASSPLDDTTIQDAATKRLKDDPGLASVSVIVISGRATLMGTVNSGDLKRAAESVVKGVQGVKSVENKIEISSQ